MFRLCPLHLLTSRIQDDQDASSVTPDDSRSIIFEPQDDLNLPTVVSDYIAVSYSLRRWVGEEGGTPQWNALQRNGRLPIQRRVVQLRYELSARGADFNGPTSVPSIPNGVTSIPSIQNGVTSVPSIPNGVSGMPNSTSNTPGSNSNDLDSGSNAQQDIEMW